MNELSDWPHLTQRRCRTGPLSPNGSWVTAGSRRRRQAIQTHLPFFGEQVMCGRAGGMALGQPSLQHWPPHPLSLERFPQVLGQVCNQRNTPLPWSPAQGPQLLGSASLLSGVAAGSLSDCSQAGGPLALPRDLRGLSHTRGHSPPAQGCCWRALLATWCPRSVALAATQHGLLLVPPAGRVLPQGSQVLQVRGTNGPALCSLGICCAPCPGPLPSICLSVLVTAPGRHGAISQALTPGMSHGILAP